jgi:AcrR family transcriptional regulator
MQGQSSPESTPESRRRRYARRLTPDKRREQLLDAALGLIAQRGYEGVSVEAVARAAGVTRPVVYDHFPNLGELLHALIAREESYALAQLAQIAPTGPSDDAVPAELFAAGVRQFLDSVASRPHSWRIILLPPEGTPAIVRQYVEEGRARLLAQVEEFVRWAIRRSGTSAEIDVEICARATLRLSEEAGRMVLTDPARFSPERYERFARTIMELIWAEG